MASTSVEIPNCTACDENSQNRAIAKCIECKDNLCKACWDSHKRLRVLKNHRIVTLTLCSSCEETGTKYLAIVRCVDCNETMCKLCLEAHRRLGALKNHKIINLDQDQSSNQHHQDKTQQQQPKVSMVIKRSPSQRVPSTSSSSSASSSQSAQSRNGLVKTLRKTSEFGREGEVRVLAARGLAIHPNGSIVIVDCQGLKLFTASGKIRFYFNMQQGFPNVKSQLSDVAITREGLIIVADETPHLKVFNQDGKFIREFVAIAPNGKTSAQLNSRIVSVLVDHKGQILIGSGNDPYYISIFKYPADGHQIASINTDVEPRCMAVSPINSNIIVGCWSDGQIHILNKSGEMQRTIGQPKHMKWLPVGICYTAENEILISNVGSPGIGIYRFDSTGAFMGCVTEDVKYPWGIAMKREDVVIADTECIKVFHWSHH